ncbi:hypothetical protein Acr_17g0005620 [Actinidia rufa]|uniref:Uncharacterized protein n=1 Tax=Actinidia rufa TaxID=165716 RepID=A0A7J0G2I0_9ERIC|nr:hypothetical protein Acr_17g0005620 [Actinidia rufa]
MMASQSSNHSSSQETRREPLVLPKLLEAKGLNNWTTPRGRRGPPLGRIQVGCPWRRRQPGHSHRMPANPVGQNGVKIEGSADPASAWTAKMIVNPLRRASGEYRPAKLPPVQISARFLMLSVTEEICAISLTAELLRHWAKTSSRQGQRLARPSSYQENPFRDDGALKSFGATDVPGVSIEPRTTIKPFSCLEPILTTEGPGGQNPRPMIPQGIPDPFHQGTQVKGDPIYKNSRKIKTPTMADKLRSGTQYTRQRKANTTMTGGRQTDLSKEGEEAGRKPKRVLMCTLIHERSTAPEPTLNEQVAATQLRVLIKRALGAGARLSAGASTWVRHHHFDEACASRASCDSHISARRRNSNLIVVSVARS